MKKILARLGQDHWPIFLIGNISAAINLILPLVLVRLFGPEDMGIYKIFFLYLGLIPFLMMAGGPLHSIYYWIGKKEHSMAFIQSAWISTNILSFSFAIILIILAFLFKTHLPLNFIQSLIVIFCATLTCPTAFYAEACMAKGQTVRSSVISLSFEIIKTVGFVFIAWKYNSIDYLFLFYLIIMLCSFFFMNTLAFFDKIISFKIDTPRIKEVLKYSLPISFSSGLFFLIEKADQLILSIFLTTEDFAFFAMGSLIIPPLYLLETSVQKKLIPQLSKNYENDDFLKMALAMKKAISDIGFLIIPAIFGLVFFSSPIIKILYTDQYLNAVIYLQIFSLSYLLLLIPHDSILRATGKTKLILRTYTFFTPVSILVLFLTAKYTNPIATLSVALILKLIPKIYCLNVSAQIIEQKINSMIPLKKLLSYTIVSLLLSLAALMLKSKFHNEITWFLVCGTSFALIYLVIFIIPKKQA